MVSGGSAEWREELEDLGDAAVDAEELEVVPRKVAAAQVVSTESAMDANAAAILGQALVAVLADRVDHAFFLGDAPKGPAGLPAVTVSDVDGDPAAGIDAYVDAVAAVEDAGGTAGIVWMHPTTWAALSKLTTGSDDVRPVLNPQPTGATPRSLLGVPVEVSRYCPTDTAYVADPSRLVVVERVPASVEVDRSVMFLSDGVAVRAIMRLEFAAPYPTTIAKVAAA